MTDTTTTTTDTDYRTYTVTVLINGTELVRQVRATHYRRDGETRNVFLYNGDDVVMEIEADHFVEIVDEDHITTITE